jgi:SHS2 domain-containing protein
VWAASREALFAESAVALIALMGSAEGAPVHEDITIDAPDPDALFVDWLSEILFLFDARRFVPRDVRVTIDGNHLRASVDGVSASSFEQTGPAVKAITYHGLELSDTEARVYVDV